MVLVIFNTLTQKKEEARARNSEEFRIFVCGPTVQGNVHLGHAKTYIAFDVLARWLRASGVKLYFLLNITDIDDKIFDRARNENVPYTMISDRFLNEFLEDMKELNVSTFSKIEPVSNYIEKSIELVGDLISKGKAYTLDGNTYFDINTANQYGKLSHQTLLQLRMKQVDAAPGKRNGVDFLLWRKIIDTEEGVWDSPFGSGRPGWHIQDSAIAFTFFGGPYDLHGGATELIFPHHESELAQDEAISGQDPFVSIWMHTGLLLKNHEKMSKSLGNVVKIRDALKDFKPNVIRMYFLKRHYRDSFDLDMKALSSTSKELEPILEASALAKRPSSEDRDLAAKTQQYALFANALDDDLDTPKALSVLLDTAKMISEASKTPGGIEPALNNAFWFMVDVLGFKLP
jgi:cysteinyl-tRNA synthetase